MHGVALRTSVDILLVEDNPDDVRLLRGVLAQSRLRLTLHVVERGEDALRFLRREPPYAQAPRPRLILLDLYLPGLSGLEVLRVVKQEAALRPIPVVVLSVSEAERNVLAAYDAGAQAFISKPPRPAAFEDAIRIIEAFWLKIAQLPAD